ncbi:MAG: hypothetical protein ACK5JO_08440, partial [Halodesulfovibrio sp.]
MTPTLNVNSRLFWLVAQFRSLDPDLESIHCVAVQPHPEKGVYIVAMNGHQAGIAHDENGEASESFVLRVDKPTLNIIKPKRSTKVKRHEQPATLRLVDFDGKPRLAVYDGWENPLHVQLGSEPMSRWDYPDWMPIAHRITECAVPSSVFPALPGYGPFCLSEFINAIATYALGIDANRCMGIYPSEGIETPVGLRFQYVPQFLGILMPMKLSQEYDAETAEERSPEDANAAAVDTMQRLRHPAWLYP